MDIYNGQLLAGKMTDIAMEETYLEHLELNTAHDNAEGNNDDADDIGNLDYGLVRDNASYHINEEDERCKGDRCKLLGNPCQEPPIYEIRRFEMIKYSFGPAVKYIAIKECEQYDLTRTEDDACHAYQEVFRIMDEGWFVTRAE
ncbi:hypothetical protein Tco_1248599 [Tanacetum coccineum]